jgi:RimJ/RimL family protein N-acetyltransferase
MEPGTIVWEGRSRLGKNILIRTLQPDDAEALCRYMNALSEERTFQPVEKVGGSCLIPYQHTAFGVDGGCFLPQDGCRIGNDELLAAFSPGGALLGSLPVKGKEMSNAKESLPALAGYSLRQLTPEELPLLQALCERCAEAIEQNTGLEPGLSLEHILGLPPGPSMAQDLAHALPPSKGYEDKFLLGIFARPEELSGVLDVIRDYPTQGEWWLGVLMLEPARRGQGLGEGVCRAVEQWAKEAGARSLRLVVSAQNRRAHQFWQRLGFEELERRIRKLSDGQESVGIIMGHAL